MGGSTGTLGCREESPGNAMARALKMAPARQANILYCRLKLLFNCRAGLVELCRTLCSGASHLHPVNRWCHCSCLPSFLRFPDLPPWLKRKYRLGRGSGGCELSVACSIPPYMQIPSPTSLSAAEVSGRGLVAISFPSHTGGWSSKWRWRGRERCGAEHVQNCMFSCTFQNVLPFADVHVCYNA